MNAKLDNINIKVRSYNTKREQKAYKAWASKKWHVNSRILLWCWQICCAVVNIDDRPIPKIRFCFFLCSYYHIHSYMQVVLMLFFYICIYPDVYNSEHVFFQTVNWKCDIIMAAHDPNHLFKVIQKFLPNVPCMCMHLIPFLLMVCAHISLLKLSV